MQEKKIMKTTRLIRLSSESVRSFAHFTDAPIAIRINIGTTALTATMKLLVTIQISLQNQIRFTDKIEKCFCDFIKAGEKNASVN